MPAEGIVIRLTRDEALVLWHFGQMLAATSNASIDHVAEMKVLLKMWRGISESFGCDPEWELPETLARQLPEAQERVDSALSMHGE